MNSSSTGIILQHHRDEAGAGFPLARRIPCTDLIQRIRYMETLSPERLDRLFVEWHRLRTDHADDPGYLYNYRGQDDSFPEAHAFQQHQLNTNKFHTLATMPVKMAASLMKGRGLDALKEWQELVGLPDEAIALWPELAAQFDELKPAKPAKIRKALASLMSERFSAEEGDYFGMKAYGGEIDGVPFLLRAAFASSGGLPQHQQFDYGIAFGEAIRLSTYPVAYEGLWMARSCWDYITETNLENCMDTLADTMLVLHRMHIQCDHVSS